MPKIARPTTLKRDTPLLDAAEELGVSQETAYRDVKRGCPHSKRGGKFYLNVAEWKGWRQSQGLKPEKGRPADDDSPDLEQARLRKENALASKYELQVARERGELVNADEMKRHWIGEIQIIKGKCLGLGAAIAPSLVGLDAAEIQGLIDQRVQQIFRELSE